MSRHGHDHTHPEPGTGMSDPIDDISKVMEPKRLLTVWSRILLLVLLVIAAITIARVCWRNFSKIDNQLSRDASKAEIQSFKRDWFVSKLQEIEGLKHQIKTAKTALASIEEQRKSTWVSRESDREIYNRTLERLMTLEGSLTAAIREYTAAMAIANPTDIAGLSSNISLE